MKLLDNNGNIIEQDFLPPPSPNDEAWYSYQLSMSSFSLPAGASGYTASQVLSNVTELRWECVVDSLVNTDSAESWLWLDNINLEK
jgi:hypothetical protein